MGIWCRSQKAKPQPGAVRTDLTAGSFGLLQSRCPSTRQRHLVTRPFPMKSAKCQFHNGLQSGGRRTWRFRPRRGVDKLRNSGSQPSWGARSAGDRAIHESLAGRVRSHVGFTCDRPDPGSVHVPAPFAVEGATRARVVSRNTSVR
jgi:hypothetical protein